MQRELKNSLRVLPRTIAKVVSFCYNFPYKMRQRQLLKQRGQAAASSSKVYYYSSQGKLSVTPWIWFFSVTLFQQVVLACSGIISADHTH